jgi:hypothetical protein
MPASYLAAQNFLNDFEFDLDRGPLPNSAAKIQLVHQPARRTSAVGRNTISHPDRGHDDVANAVAGAAALSKFGGYDTSLRWVSGDAAAGTPSWIPLNGI